jgi:ribosomal protein S12 methylthiotransferase accessory factor YcaO
MRPVVAAVLAAGLLVAGCGGAPGATPDPSAALQGQIDELVRDRGGTAQVYREILTESSCDRLFTMSENYANLRDDTATSSEKVDVYDSYSSLAGQRWIDLGC